MNETDFRAELRTIRTPTLILNGDIDKSALLDLRGRPTHELIDGSKLLVYENAAHGLPYTHTGRMLADIVAFAEPSDIHTTRRIQSKTRPSRCGQLREPLSPAATIRSLLDKSRQKPCSSSDRDSS